MKNLTWQNPEQLFVAQELINKVKSKCCGIKDKVTNYGTASTESVGFGSGAYSYWDYYEIEYNFYQKPAELYTERSAIPYYSSISPNRYNYSKWAVRAIKNK